jgi:hypothetical protein
MSKPKALKQHPSTRGGATLTQEQRAARFAALAAGLLARPGRGRGRNDGRTSTATDTAKRAAALSRRGARSRDASS